MGSPNPIGWVANKLGRPLDYVTWTQRAHLDTRARVLDVGCGNGKVLLRMRLGGFEHCTGIDPFIDETLRYPNGVIVHKTDLGSLAEHGGTFDFIMFHHSLEHLTDPLEALRTTAQLLSPHGCVLVAVPVADSDAWETYRENWYNLDAPRHIHLLTSTSMAILAERSGLIIADTVSAGMISQFSESEKYKRDITGDSPVKALEILGTEKMAEFQRLTEELNRNSRGDQTMFYLRKAPYYD